MHKILQISQKEEIFKNCQFPLDLSYRILFGLLGLESIKNVIRNDENLLTKI